MKEKENQRPNGVILFLFFTLKVENASDAISKVLTSTYRKKLKNSSECNIILANASYRAHSRNIVPQFKAIS